jgi:hypothetical protein
MMTARPDHAHRAPGCSAGAAQVYRWLLVELEAMAEPDTRKVRKTPCRPRSWANFSLL